MQYLKCYDLLPLETSVVKGSSGGRRNVTKQGGFLLHLAITHPIGTECQHFFFFVLLRLFPTVFQTNSSNQCRPGPLVGIVPRLQSRRPGKSWSIFGAGRKCSLFEQLRYPSSHLRIGSVHLTAHLHLVLKVKIEWNYDPTPLCVIPDAVLNEKAQTHSSLS